MKGIMFVRNPLCYATTGPLRSLFSKDCLDPSLSGVSSYSPCAPCSVTKWEECKFDFHSSLETPLVKSPGHCLSLHCSGYCPDDAGELLQATLLPTRKRKYRPWGSSRVNRAGERFMRVNGVDTEAGGRERQLCVH